MREHTFDLNKLFFYPFISILTPFFFIVSYDRLINSLNHTNVSFIYVLTVIFAGVIEVISANYFSKKYSDMFTRLREFFFILLCYALFFYILHKELYIVTYISLLVFMQWALTFIIHKNFFSRDLLFNDVKGKKGTELIIALRNSGYVSTEAFFDLKKIKETILFFQVIIFLVVIIYNLSNITLDLLTKVSIFINFIFSITVISIINFYSYEQDILFKGFLLSRKEKNEKLSFIIIFIFIVAFISLVLSFFIKFFTYKDLIAILDFLSSLLFPTAKKEIFFSNRNIEDIATPSRKNDITKFVDSSVIFKIWGFVVLAVIFITFFTFTTLILIFLFKPIFKKFNIKLSKVAFYIKNYLANINLLLKNIIAFLRNLFSFSKELLINPKEKKYEEDIEKKEKRLKKENLLKEKRKKRELNKFLHLFNLLIKKIGKDKNYYKKHYNATDYVNNLIKDVSIKEEYIINNFYKVAYLFDEAFFSVAPVKKEKFILYKKLIKTLIKELK